jgi:hypothetical protein
MRRFPGSTFSAELGVPGMHGTGRLRYLEGSAPRPVAPPSRQGSNRIDCDQRSGRSGQFGAVIENTRRGWTASGNEGVELSYDS